MKKLEPPSRRSADLSDLPQLPHPEPTALPSSGSALGRDPFEELTGLDPLVERLDELEELASLPSRRVEPRPLSRFSAHPSAPGPRAGPAAKASRTEGSPEPATPKRRPPRDNIARLTHRRWSATPRLSEIELSEPQGLLDRLSSPEDRRRLTALAHLVEGETPYDRFGFSPSVVRNAWPFFQRFS